MHFIDDTLHKPAVGPEGGKGTRNGGGRNTTSPLAVCVSILVLLLVILGFMLAIYFGASTGNLSSSNGGYNGRYRQYNDGYYRQNEL